MSPEIRDIITSPEAKIVTLAAVTAASIAVLRGAVFIDKFLRMYDAGAIVHDAPTDRGEMEALVSAGHDPHHAAQLLRNEDSALARAREDVALKDKWHIK